MELCRQLECEPYINGNVGSGTVQEMSEWVEYLTFDGISPMAELRKQNGHAEPWKVKYFGVGNENWGCGGNMTPEFYLSLIHIYKLKEIFRHREQLRQIHSMAQFHVQEH